MRPLRARRLTCFGLLLLAGCSTIMTGTTEKISLTSDPPGASVSILPIGESAVTPAEIELPKQYTYLLRAELACHAEARARIENRVHPWMWGNILLGGFIGLIIDVTGGGGFDLEPEEIHFHMVAREDCPAAQPETVVPPLDGAGEATEPRLEGDGDGSW